MVNIGDKVKFLNAVGGGIVTRFQSQKVVVVEDYDGFEIPVLITELVKIEEEASYERIKPGKTPKPAPVEEKKNVAPPKPKPAIIKGNNEPKFFMAFYPTDQKNPVGGEIEIYLINDSNFTLLYQYCHYTDGKYTTVSHGELEPNTKSYLEGLSQTDLANLPKYYFRIVPVMKEVEKLIAPVTKEVSVHGMKFYKEKSFSANDFFNGNAIIFDLMANPMQEEVDRMTDTDFKGLIKEKDKANRPEQNQKKKIVIPDLVEIDLHIEHLIENTNGLSNHEILTIQMDRFHSEMKSAIEKGAKRIVFIHGVGNGVLKQEIHKKLKSTYAKYYFQDASFQEYGYGATMVVLRKK